MNARLPLALLAAALAAHALAADVFSPGDLARPHAQLSGLENCTKCHPKGEQLSQARCLDCHAELAPRVAAGRGFHGRIAPAERECWTCHHEHQGREFPLVDFGPGGEKRFDHAKAGEPLGGKHAAVACERCHAPALVQDFAIRALLAKSPRRRTFLGAPPLAACAACHFDEHRGALGPDCKRCHDDRGWKPAAGFDHAKTAYALTGKHARVACEKCHPRAEDRAADAGALTTPIHPSFHFRYRPIAHASCLDCHKDPHQGRLGTSCTSCHVTDDWKAITARGTAERAFHDRTRYPLQGAHRTVGCIPCHGPFPGEPARFKPLAFERCTDCHADAHAGQLADGAGAPGAEPKGACERCHTVGGFQPVRFGVEEHAKTRYPLEKAHAVVACGACHPHDPKLADRFPARARADLERRGRPVKLSLSVYDVAGDLARCETCHADPHAGQLAREGGCAACHDLGSFETVRFDHAKDSRFPLRGAHAKAACAACHRSAPAAGGGVAVHYRPLPVACEGCHRDVHAGQLGACARCHGEDDWKKQPAFRHEPPFTEYRLTGKHAKVACERCHAPVAVPGGASARRYKPLPRSCDGCHADFHEGAFRRFVP